MKIKRIRLSEIAARASLSSAGASLALRNHPHISESTRLRVQKIARELGYAPAPRKSAAHTMRRFGFVYCEPTVTQFDAASFEPALQLLMRDSMALNARFELLLLDDDLVADNTRQKLLQFAGHLDGVLLYGRIHDDLVELLNQLGRPSVVIGETDIPHERAQELNLQRVTDEPMQGGLLATQYLLKRGRRHIAFVGGIRMPGFFYDQWHRGYLLAHAEAGLPVSPRLVTWHEIGNPLSERIGALAEFDVRPDAIVWPDAGIAADMRPALHDRGLNLDPADEVIAAASHAPSLQGQEHYPQVLGDLAAMTEEAVRRLQTITKRGVNRAVTIVVPNVIRNMEARHRAS